MRVYAEITSGNRYPITTQEYVDGTSWSTCASRAVKKHRDDLRSRGKLRQMGKRVNIILQQVGEGE